MHDTLKPESVSWALTHIQRFGDTDLFPVPFEYTCIAAAWHGLSTTLVSLDLASVECGPHRRYLVPKPTWGFRVAAQLDPLDALLYAALVYEAAEPLEQQRMPPERRIACSYRVEIGPRGELFRSGDGWKDFTEVSRDYATNYDCSHVVLADIADFYNQISHHRVRNILETSGVGSSRAANIEHFLMSITQGHSRGIPVGPSASILLAEAILSDVDVFLQRRGFTHTRYVDDFRIFCPNEREANQALHDLAEYLYTSHRLALRPEKSKPMPVDEFRDQVLLDPEAMEAETRERKLQELADALRDFSGYHIEPDDIDDHDRHQVTTDSLKELFDACIGYHPLHLGWARFIYRQAMKLDTAVLMQRTLGALPQLTPVLRDVIRYLVSTTPAADRPHVCSALLEFYNSSEFAFTSFVKAWIIEGVLSMSTDAMNEEVTSLCKNSDLGLRPVAEAARRFGHLDWARSQKETWQNSGPWERRAILWAASVLPRDERRAWLRRVKTSAGPLERAVAHYVQSLP